MPRNARRERKRQGTKEKKIDCPRLLVLSLTTPSQGREGQKDDDRKSQSLEISGGLLSSSSKLGPFSNERKFSLALLQNCWWTVQRLFGFQVKSKRKESTGGSFCRTLQTCWTCLVEGFVCQRIKRPFNNDNNNASSSPAAVRQRASMLQLPSLEY